MEKKRKKYFPIFVDLSEEKIVVVGAGTIAKRRIRALADFAGRLVVIAPEVNPELRDLEAAGRIEIWRKRFEKEDILGAALVIAATNDRRLNQAIYTACKEAGIPVNVCNDKTRCDFYFPVLAYDETVVAGVSSSGQDAARARRVAEQIRALLTQAPPSDGTDDETGAHRAAENESENVAHRAAENEKETGQRRMPEDKDETGAHRLAEGEGD
ncbi:MAG: bifunctional precorrin-2 dehydrogenase/sirohydrochlorin ferrochelatase [Lachnospiraceae bacterium]|nr:bifunctional precorrin-2 dehydrogenase/sirohydrochlorin ferrochelatase [Lachnospiraceae bacterium]